MSFQDKLDKLFEGKFFSFQKQDRYGNNVHLLRVESDTFIHISHKPRIKQILESNALLMNPPYQKFGIDAVTAVSSNWGWWVPGVQTTHHGDTELSAVAFQTNVKPKIGHPEEVIWDKDVTFTRAKEMTFDQAQIALQNTPYRLEDDSDVVCYDIQTFKQLIG
jgi:hypothetical protein